MTVDDWNAGLENLVKASAPRVTKAVLAESVDPISLTYQKIEKIVLDCLIIQATDQGASYKIIPSGKQRFPDITITQGDRMGGVEVKSTRSISSPWTIQGGSIFEGNRVEGMGDIWVVFTKLANGPETRVARYAEAITGISVTHSPRYQLDLSDAETRGAPLFRNREKVDLSYEEVSASDNPFELLKGHLLATADKTGAFTWWSDEGPGPERETSLPGLVRLWENLREEEKRALRARAFLMFPELIQSGGRDKYTNLTLWLLREKGIISSSLRDKFTGGGRKEREGQELSAAVATFVDSLPEIRDLIANRALQDCANHWQINLKKRAEKVGFFQAWSESLLAKIENQVDEEVLELCLGKLLPPPVSK